MTQEQHFEIALAPLPRGKVAVPDINWHSFGIIKGSKQPDASWKFLRWSAEQAHWLADHSGGEAYGSADEGLRGRQSAAPEAGPPM